MDDPEFDARSARALAAIERAIENCGAACDCETKADGVLELEFEDGSKIVVNRHGAAREIWVAARSGGYHFRFQDGSWVSARDGQELFAVLSRCVSEQSGAPVVLGVPR